MKLKTLVILAAAAMIAMAGCSDDITNIIEEVPATSTPDGQTPVPTEVPPTNTPGTPPTQPPSDCVTPGPDEEVVCGDGVCHAPEDCDVGGICVGGANNLDPCTSPDDCDGGRCTVVGGVEVSEGSCAANCTIEARRVAPYADGTSAVVQTQAFAIPVPLSGQQTVQTGRARDDDTVDINGEVTFRGGDYPIVTKAPDIQIDPASVLGLVCACVRGIEVPAFGPNNSATGLISCGGPLDDIDYIVSQDHHTDPLDDFETSETCGLPADPDCNMDNEIVPGVISRSCREGEDEDCNDPTQNRHPGVCNSARSYEFSGTGPAGSGIIFNNTSIGLLMDRGECNLGFAGMDPCPHLDYGPDCIPCTDDDLDFGVPENNPTTTGRAEARVVNAVNVGGAVIGEGSLTPCSDNDDCNSTTCDRNESCAPMNNDPGAPTVCGLRCGSASCQTSAQGAPFSCDELANNPSGGLSGGAFAVSFPSIDAATIGDNVTSTLFVFE